jgi:hypothetical protein
MVWAAIGIDWRSPLIFLKGNVNAGTYCTMLNHYHIFDSIAESAQVRGATIPFFQQDGAPAHTAKTTIEWLQKKTPLIKNWPPNSPDLSPIEMIWGILKRKLAERQPKNLEEFKGIIRREYNNIPQATINRMIFGMNSRFRLCIAHHGECIGHLLTKHRLREDYVIPSDILQPRDLCLRNIGTTIKLRAKAIFISDSPTPQLPDAAIITLSDIETPQGQNPKIITMHVPFKDDWDPDLEYFFQAKVMGQVSSSPRSPPTLAYFLNFIGMIIDPHPPPEDDELLIEDGDDESFRSEDSDGNSYSQSDDES